jgi:hypothetical protein
MKKLLLPILVSLVILLPLLTPLPSEALSLVPCGNTENPVPCTLCHIVSGVASLIGYIRNIMVFIALAVITAMGVLYIVSSGNQSTMETAKKGIFASLIGIAVILSAWLIVNTVMFTVFQAKSDLGVGASFSISGGFSFACPGSGTGSSAAPATAPTPVASSIRREARSRFPRVPSPPSVPPPPSPFPPPPPSPSPTAPRPPFPPAPPRVSPQDRPSRSRPVPRPPSPSRSKGRPPYRRRNPIPAPSPLLPLLLP